MQADEPETLGLYGISFAVSQNENDVVLELSADVGNLSRLRRTLNTCLENFPALLNNTHLQMEVVNRVPELILDLPEPDPEDERLFKLMIVGSFCSGKTSLMKRYVENIYTMYKASIDVDFSLKVVMLGGVYCRLQLWDTAGAGRFRESLRVYFRGSAGIVLTVDLTRDLSDAEEVFREILRHMDFSENFMVLAGTKCDDRHRKIDRLTAERFAEKLGVPYIEVSAKEDINIAVLFETVAKMALLQQQPKYCFRMTIKNISSEILAAPRLYDQLNYLMRNAPILFPIDPVCDMQLSLYKKALCFLEESEGKQGITALKLHIKNYTSDNVFIRQAAMEAVRTVPDLARSIDYFMNALKSKSDSERFEAKDALRVFNKLDTPEVIQICIHLLANIESSAKQRAVNILKEIEKFEGIDIVHACFTVGYFLNDVGAQRDAFRILVEINVVDIIDSIKNRVVNTLLREAMYQGDEKAIKILTGKHGAVLPDDVKDRRESGFKNSKC